MTATNSIHGHLVVFDEGIKRYRYADGTIIDRDSPRPCPRCGRARTAEGHDICLGTLPGVLFACCGHGNTDDAYVVFDTGDGLRGEEALKWFKGREDACTY